MNALFRNRSGAATPSSRPADPAHEEETRERQEARDRTELAALREMVPPPAAPGSRPPVTRSSKHT